MKKREQARDWQTSFHQNYRELIESDQVEAVIAAVEQAFPGGSRETVDGLSIAFDDFRFNIRKSNTEPLLRLNVETRGDIRLLKQKTAELLAIIQG